MPGSSHQQKLNAGRMQRGARKPAKKVHFDDKPAIIMNVSSSTIASLRGRSDSLWLDSRATHHVVNDASMLRDIRSPSVPSVTLGGGEEHPVLSEGDLLLGGGPRGNVLLTGVLHVPSLGINLISTPQITSKNGTCWVGPHLAEIYDPQGRVILRGRKAVSYTHLTLPTICSV